MHKNIQKEQNRETKERQRLVVLLIVKGEVSHAVGPASKQGKEYRMTTFPSCLTLVLIWAKGNIK
jgi:hypothetical protein